MKKTTILNSAALSRLLRALSLLLQSGISASDAVYLMAEDGEKELLTAMGKALDGGAPLSEAMRAAGAFPHHACAMAAIGEATGRLDEALSSLADHYEEEERREKEVKSAVAYPAILLLLMLAITGVLITKVLPIFDDVYASLGGSLTGLAAGLLALGGALQSAMPVVLLILAVLVISGLGLALSPALRARALGAYRKKRGHKGVGAKMVSARFARCLSMALRSGLPLEEGAAMAAGLLQDIPAAAKKAAAAAERLRRGEDAGRVLSESGLLSSKDCRMLSIGLKSGKGDEVMVSIARRTNEEASEALRTLLGRIEPAMVLSASGIVGVILLSVMLPLMNIMTAIG